MSVHSDARAPARRRATRRGRRSAIRGWNSDAGHQSLATSATLARHLFVPLAVILAAGSSCRASDSRELVVAHEAEIGSLDPIKAADTVSNSVLSNVYDCLVDFDRDMHLVPSLAVSWQTPSELTWILGLRHGVRTHNDDWLTAEDVVASLDRTRLAADSSLAERLATVEKVKVLDAGTIRIDTKEPDPLLMHRLTFILITARQRTQTALLPGTGPYRLIRSNRDGIEMEAFRDYWRGAPAIRRARFVTVRPGEETLQRFAARTLDVARVAGEFDGIPDVTLRIGPSPRNLYLWMRSQVRNTPLADHRVRRAMALAIDREAVVGRLGGWGEPLTQLVPRTVFGHDPRLAPLSFDLQEARRLMSEAGYSQGFEIELTHARGLESIVDLLRSQLAVVRVVVHPVALEWPDMLRRWRHGELPFFLAVWRFDNGEASFFLHQCILSRDTAQSWNPGYSNHQVDTLIREGLRLFSASERGSHFIRIMALLQDDLPLIPLASRVDLYGLRRGISWQPRLDGKLLVYEMARNTN